MIVNLLTLEQTFKTCARFRPASTGPDHAFRPLVESGRNVTHVSKLRSKVNKFTIIFYSWSHEQYISFIRKQAFKLVKCPTMVEYNKGVQRWPNG